MAERLILITISPEEIIDHNATYFRGDLNLPPTGLDPNLEYLIEIAPLPPPIYDSRLQNLIITKTITDIPHPVYAYFNQYQITYSITEKTNEQKIDAVLARERQANDGVFPEEQRVKYDTIGVAANGYQLDNGTPPTGISRDVRDEYEARAVDMISNNDNAELKIADIIAGTPIDLDSGWIETPLVIPTP